MEAECQEVQDQLLQLKQSRDALQDEFVQLSDSNRKMWQQLYNDSYGSEGQVHAYESEKRRLEMKLEELEELLKEKDIKITELDAKASDYLLRVTTTSNSLFDDEDDDDDDEAAAQTAAMLLKKYDSLISDSSTPCDSSDEDDDSQRILCTKYSTDSYQIVDVLSPEKISSGLLDESDKSIAQDTLSSDIDNSLSHEVNDFNNSLTTNLAQNEKFDDSESEESEEFEEKEIIIETNDNINQISEINVSEKSAGSENLEKPEVVSNSVILQDSDKKEIVKEILETDSNEIKTVETDSKEIEVVKVDSKETLVETDSLATIGILASKETVAVTDSEEAVAVTDTNKALVEADSTATIGILASKETVAVTDSQETVTVTETVVTESEEIKVNEIDANKVNEVNSEQKEVVNLETEIVKPNINEVTDSVGVAKTDPTISIKSNSPIIESSDIEISKMASVEDESIKPESNNTTLESADSTQTPEIKSSETTENSDKTDSVLIVNDNTDQTDVPTAKDSVCSLNDNETKENTNVVDQTSNSNDLSGNAESEIETNKIEIKISETKDEVKNTEEIQAPILEVSTCSNDDTNKEKVDEIKTASFEPSEGANKESDSANENLTLSENKNPLVRQASSEDILSLSSLLTEFRQVKDDMGKCMTLKEGSFSDLEDKLLMTNKQVSSLRDSMSLLTTTLHEKELNYKSLEHENFTAKIELEKKIAELQQVNDACSVLKEEKEEISDKVQTLETMAAEYRSEIENLVAVKSHSEEEINIPESDKGSDASSDEEIAATPTLLPDIIRLEGKVKTLEREKITFSEKLKASNKHLKALAREREHKQEECELLKKKVEKVETKMNELQGTFDSLVQAISGERDQLLAEVNERNSQIQQLNVSLRTVKDNHKKEMVEVETKKLEIEKERDLYKQGEMQVESIDVTKYDQYKELLKENENLKQTLQNNIEAVNSLKDNCSSIQGQSSSNLKENEDLKQKLLVKTEEADALQTTINNIQNEMSNFVSCLKDDMAHLKEETEKTKQEKTNVEQSLLDLQNEHALVVGKKDEFEQSVSELDKSNKERLESIEILKVQLDDLQQQYDDLNSKSFSVSSEMLTKEDEYKEELNAREATIQELRITLTNNQKQSMENYHALQDDMAALQIRLGKDLEDSRNLAKNWEEKCKQEEENSKKEIERLKKKVRSMEKKIASKDNEEIEPLPDIDVKENEEVAAEAATAVEEDEEEEEEPECADFTCQATEESQDSEIIPHPPKPTPEETANEQIASPVIEENKPESLKISTIVESIKNEEIVQEASAPVIKEIIKEVPVPEEIIKEVPVTKITPDEVKEAINNSEEGALVDSVIYEGICKEKNELKEQLNAKTDEAKSLQEKIAKLQGEMSNFVTFLQSEVAMYKIEVERTNEERGKLEASLSEIKDQHRALTVKNEEVESSLAKALDRIEELKPPTPEPPPVMDDDAIKQAEAIIKEKSYEEKYEEANKERIDLHEQLKNKTEEADSLQKKITTLQTEMSNFVSYLQSEVAVYRTKNEEIIKAKEDLEGTLSSLQKQHEVVVSQKDNLEKSIAEAQTAVQSLQAVAAAADPQNIVADKKSEAPIATDSIEAEKSLKIDDENSTKIAEEAEMKPTEEPASVADKTNENKETSVEEAEKTVSDTESKINLINQQILKTQEEFTRVMNVKEIKIKDLEVNVNKLENSLENKSSYINELEKIIESKPNATPGESTEGQENGKDQEPLTYLKVIDKLSQQVNELKCELGDCHSQCSVLKTTIENLEKEKIVLEEEKAKFKTASEQGQKTCISLEIESEETVLEQVEPSVKKKVKSKKSAVKKQPSTDSQDGSADVSEGKKKTWIHKT